MGPSADPAAWKTLGEQLTLRRFELDPRYQNRTVFCAERGLDYRLVYDIEEAKRTNFRSTTLAGIAVGYEVTLDSVLGLLRDPRLRLQPLSSPAAAPPRRRVREDDWTEAAIRLLIEAVSDPEPGRPPLHRPTLHRWLEATWALEDGNGQPQDNRAELLVTALELALGHAEAAAERRNGTTDTSRS